MSTLDQAMNYLADIITNTENGSIPVGNNILIQYGTAQIGSNSYAQITYPTAYEGTPLVIVTGQYPGSGAITMQTSTSPGRTSCVVYTRAVNGAQIASGNKVSWLAIGTVAT